MANYLEREAPADRSAAESFQMLYGDGSRIAPTVPPFTQKIIILPVPVEMERQSTPNPTRAKFAGKRKRCDKCGCECMNKYKCSTCRNYHTGECWMATGGCYQCGDLGHRIRDCPKPSKRNKKLARAQAETVKTSTSQEASSRVPAPVISEPQPEAEAIPE